MSTLPERLEEAVKEQLDGNWAELARRAGLRPSTLQQVKRGADARASTLLRIADALSLSLEWLIRGEGPRLRSGAPEPERDDAAALAAIERTQVAEIFAELGLGRIALVARRGSFEGLWRTAQEIARSTERSFTLEDLVDRLRSRGHA
ncbi:MAG: helix-turn-helix domain-containing protein, partial [Myxococcales bacterium]|nr:helix-turn-helix domain-containing protein [Myxococcales bacterium]